MVRSRTARRRLWLTGVLASTAVVGATFLLPAYAGGDNDQRGEQTKLRASLTGPKQVPGPGDADGRGRARITLKNDQICFRLAWKNIEAPTAAHIHIGARTAAGPVVVLLMEVDGGLKAPVNRVGGCAPASADLIKAIQDNPRGYYVNIHNATFPSGALRGQLHR